MSEKGRRREGTFSPDKETDLSNSVVGIRVFKVGDFDDASLEVFRHQVDTVKNFVEKLAKFTDKPPRLRLITNSDLKEEGANMLDASGLEIIQTDVEKTQRRAHLGKVLVGSKSKSKGEFSYVDMLNALDENVPASEAETASAIFASYDLAQRPEVLFRQMAGMEILYKRWQKEKPGNLAIAGSLLAGVHDTVLAREVADGKANITFENLSRLFPNNALSLVPPHTRFSGIADNALSGEIAVEGAESKKESIGGNEDFMYAFKEMLHFDRDAVLLVDPYIASEREGEVKGIESKYERRKKIQHLYAQRIIDKLKRTPWPEERAKSDLNRPIEEIVEGALDQHLFFARIDERGEPEILLTKRQKEQKIKAPI